MMTCYNLTQLVPTRSGSYIHKPIGPTKFLTKAGLIDFAKAAYHPASFKNFYVTEWDGEPTDPHSAILAQTDLDKFIQE